MLHHSVMTQRVLVVDDDADIRSLLQMTLGFDGFEVVGHATNGLEAIEQATALRPDLIVLDLTMPIMGGLEALPLLRTGSPNSRVVILSALSSSQMKEQTTAAGASAYVEKPEAITRLAQTLRQVCMA